MKRIKKQSTSDVEAIPIESLTSVDNKRNKTTKLLLNKDSIQSQAITPEVVNAKLIIKSKNKTEKNPISNKSVVNSIAPAVNQVDGKSNVQSSDKKPIQTKQNKKKNVLKLSTPKGATTNAPQSEKIETILYLNQNNKDSEIQKSLTPQLNNSLIPTKRKKTKSKQNSRFCPESKRRSLPSCRDQGVSSPKIR